MYQGIMEPLKHTFCLIIAEILNNVKLPKFRGSFSPPDLEKHKKELCEACQLGVCGTNSKKSKFLSTNMVDKKDDD